MGQQQSKDELLYQKAVEGDIQAIKSFSSDGAGLEWIDKKRKTPLIAARMNPERYILAKTLIELGANVNAYRPSRHAGTPLHHAAKRGLNQTVRLLLSHGANLFVRNDDCQTPLDVARFRGFANVARLVESYGPGFLEVLAPKLLSRKIWVVAPCAPHNPAKPLKLDLAIYSNFQDAQPRTVVALWRAGIEEPKLNLQDTTLIGFDKPTGTRYKFAASNDGDKQQIQSFYLACRGIPRVTHSPLPPDIQASAPTYSTQTAEEAAELATAINASIDDNLNGWGNSTNKTTHNGWGIATESSPLEGSSSSNSLINEPTEEQQNGWGVPDPKHDKNKIQHNIVGKLNEPCKEDYNGWGEPVSKPAENNTKIIYMPQVQHIPSAPPIPMEGLDEGPIEYPSIDSSPVDVLPIPFLANKKVGKSNEIEDEDGSSCCVTCWEAPVEGACVPCGHMAGCMACLDEIKTIKGVCPVCRTKINQVTRIYAV